MAPCQSAQALLSLLALCCILLCALPTAQGAAFSEVPMTRRAATPPPAPFFNNSGGITILVGGDVFTPSPLGLRDVVMAGGNILALLLPADTPSLMQGLKASGTAVKVVNVAGSVVMPGLVDVHVHAAGGGGEMGPSSRTPAAQLSELIEAGTTTLVGLLGTDGVSRSLSWLLQVMKGLSDDGLTTYMWTGSYRLDPKPYVLTQGVQNDIILIDKVIGVGEIAISDHRSSWPDYQEVAALISDARVAGMLSGKAGVVHFHVGDGPTLIDVLFEVVNKTTIPYDNIYPTHISVRGDDLRAAGPCSLLFSSCLVDLHLLSCFSRLPLISFHRLLYLCLRSLSCLFAVLFCLVSLVRVSLTGIKWLGQGGMIDCTADSMNGQDNSTTNYLLALIKGEHPLHRVSLSSDAYGSDPFYNAAGKLLSYGVGSPKVLMRTIRSLVLDHGVPLHIAMQFCTVNPARFLGFKGKGEVKVNGPADLLVLSPVKEGMELQYVFSGGKVMRTPKWVKRGMFEGDLF